MKALVLTISHLVALFVGIVVGTVLFSEMEPTNSAVPSSLGAERSGRVDRVATAPQPDQWTDDAYKFFRDPSGHVGELVHWRCSVTGAKVIGNTTVFSLMSRSAIKHFQFFAPPGNYDYIPDGAMVEITGRYQGLQQDPGIVSFESLKPTVVGESIGMISAGR